MFATDRDLLVLMPSLFTEVTWESQRVLTGLGVVSGSELTLTDSDVLFDAAGVEAGSVLLVDATAYEVTARSGGKKVGLSRVRARDAAPVPPRAGEGIVTVITFRPQIDFTHRQLLRGAGVRDASLVSNADELAIVEAMGTIAMVCHALSAASPEEASLAARAAQWQRRYESECDRAVVRVDEDGDGAIEQVRRLNGGLLIRR